MRRYEYQFVRMGEGMLGVKKEAKEGYQGVVERASKDGWRLVQIFSPSIGPDGRAKFYEIILEREFSR